MTSIHRTSSGPGDELLCCKEGNIGLLENLDLIFLEDEAMATAPGSGAVLLLNSTATHIARLAKIGFDRDEIIQALVEHSGLMADQIQQDFAALESTVLHWIAEANTKEHRTHVASPLDPPLLSATYTLFERRVRIDYPDHDFSSFLHPYFAAFQVHEQEPDLLMQFEVEDSFSTVRCGAAAFTAPPSGHGALGAVCLALLFHDKPEQKMLKVFMHCGGVLGRHGAWLIGGASGKGKSTMVTALDAAGHLTLGDDILPINPHARLAYPMPTSLSVKAGSWDRIAKTHPDQVAAQDWHTVAKKKVRRIAPQNPPRDSDRTGHPIAGFLFPDRTDENVVAIEPMSVKDAMISLCDKFGRFPSLHSDLAALAACMASVPRYRLRYRDADSLLPELSPLL